jgi:hypothetical protein
MIAFGRFSDKTTSFYELPPYSITCPKDVHHTFFYNVLCPSTPTLKI